MPKRKKLISPEEIGGFFQGSWEREFPPLLNTKQAAALLGVSAKTIDKWKNAGLLEGTNRKRGSKVRYVRDKLLDVFFNGTDWST